MKSRSKIVVRKANIICPAENFYCARKSSENFEIPHRASPTMHGRRDPQTAAEELSHNIAKRWRMDETRARMGSAYFELLSIRRETELKQSRDGRALLTALFYVSLLAGKMITVSTGSSLALDFLGDWHFVGIVKKISIFTANINIFWYGSDEMSNDSHSIFCTFSSHTTYVNRKVLFFDVFLSMINIKFKRTYKISSEKELRHFPFYCTGTIIVTVLAW